MLIDFDRLVSTTHDTVNNLFQYRNGGDALMLYFRYIQQNKMQKNNRSKSTNTFMQKATGWGTQRLVSAKKVLLDLGFIEEIRTRDDKGHISGVYIKTNFIIETEEEHQKAELSTKALTHRVGDPPSGQVATNTLVKKINTLVKKENAGNSGNFEILKTYLDKQTPGTTRFRFYSFLLEHIEKIETPLSEQKLEEIEQKLGEFREKLGDERAKLEIQSFIEHHKTEGTIMKSILLRLNTWLTKAITPFKKGK